MDWQTKENIQCWEFPNTYVTWSLQLHYTSQRETKWDSAWHLCWQERIWPLLIFCLSMSKENSSCTTASSRMLAKKKDNATWSRIQNGEDNLSSLQSKADPLRVLAGCEQIHHVLPTLLDSSFGQDTAWMTTIGTWHTLKLVVMELLQGIPIFLNSSPLSIVLLGKQTWWIIWKRTKRAMLCFYNIKRS